MMVTGETLLRLAAFAFLCTLVVTHRPAPQVVVVDHLPDDRPALDDHDLEDPGTVASEPTPMADTRAYVNRELVDAIDRDPWQLLNPSLVRAFGLDDRDVVVNIRRAGQPADANQGPSNCVHVPARGARLLTLAVARDGHERLHEIYVID